MAPPTKNDFLDVAESEDEDLGYDSEQDLRKGGRSAKRRKIDSDDDAASDVDIEGSDEEKETTKPDGKPSAKDDKEDEDEDNPGKLKRTPKELKLTSDLPDITRPLTKKNLVASEAAIKKSGVVYLSRIPPFMKPQKLRSLLEPYGTINRIFLAPEDPAAHTRRVRAGGNKKKSYTEGWVEFVKKKDAKAVAELLNAQNIGGKKGSYYHDDLWNLLYLKGFKWHNLTDQIATENAERSSRMRAEIGKTTKENKEFVKNVERAKMLDGMQAKAKKRKADAGAGASASEAAAPKEFSRTFKQIPLAKKKLEVDDQPEQVTRVLSKIF